ncbi:MAG: hypothetical protein ACRCZG_03165, partial [Culicoidibacterales bacterium]
MATKKLPATEEVAVTEISPAQQEVNTLVEKALVALESFYSLNQEQVDFIVAKASVAALDKHGELAMH